jgi:hypothetical protein
VPHWDSYATFSPTSLGQPLFPDIPVYAQSEIAPLRTAWMQRRPQAVDSDTHTLWITSESANEVENHRGSAGHRLV